MNATSLPDIHLPAAGVTAISAADPAEWIDGQTINVGRRWWTMALAEHGFEDTILGETIARRDIFAIADAAQEDPSASLILLWNSLAWGSGSKRRLNKARIASVARDRDGASALLQRAAQASRSDPLKAYSLLYPNNKTALRGLGPAFFTKYLYFAGAGSADHRCCILDRNVAAALRERCGWKSLPDQGWFASTYERYALLLDQWVAKYGFTHRDMIERCLFDEGKTIS